MGFENMQMGKAQSRTPEEEEKLNASRRENERQFENDADARNENRNFVKKAFGVGEMSAMDVAHEEALGLNDLDSVEKRLKMMTEEDVSILIETHDIKGMVEFVTGNASRVINNDVLALMPREVIESPEVQSLLEKNIMYQFNREGSGDYGLEQYTLAVKRANRFVKLGLMSTESVQKILTSESNQKQLEDIVTYTYNNKYNINPKDRHKLAVERANKFVKLGLLIKERADQVLTDLQSGKTGKSERELYNLEN